MGESQHFLGQNAPCEKIVFSNITYKEGRFNQKRSELEFRCESGRKGENRYPNWRYSQISEETRHKALIMKEA